MKEEKNFNGAWIGAVFTVGSLLFTLTFFIPIISVFPGVIVEALAEAIVDNEPYSNVGKTSIALLSLIFVTTLSIALFRIRQTVLKGEKISTGRIIRIMTGQYFIVHALSFDLYWGLALNFRSDGQLLFAALDSFPFSSWVFIPIGLLIDGVKNSTSVTH